MKLQKINSLNQFNYILGIAFDSSNNLYVSDRYNNRVTKWTTGATEGVVVAGTGSSGSSLNQLNEPLITDLWMGLGGAKISKNVMSQNVPYISMLDSDLLKPTSNSDDKYPGMTPHERRVYQINSVKSKSSMLSKLISQISIGVMLVGIIGVGLTTKSMGTISKHPVAVIVALA